MNFRGIFLSYGHCVNQNISYRACIDTSERGELESGIHLGEYRVTQQWASLTPTDQYNISINVHNDGNILEIVGMCCKYFNFLFCVQTASWMFMLYLLE